jgi:zinc transporter 2
VLHVIGDLVQSMGVALAGALIWYNQEDPRWYIADPICTFVFSILVLLTTSQVLRDIIQVLMERTPRSMDVPELMEAMREVEGIEDVHDLHVWNISTGIPVLTAHVHVAHAADHSSILLQLERSFQRRGIKHSTVQICNPVPGGQV